MNGKDVKYFVMAFSSERGKCVKCLIFLPKKFAIFSYLEFLLFGICPNYFYTIHYNMTFAPPQKLSS